MKAYIYIGGGCDTDALIFKPRAGDLTVAADCGYLLAKKLNIAVDVFVGDRDSLKTEPDAKSTVTLPAVKDVTDTAAAVDEAVSRGADEIILIGGLGGRFDHSLANVLMLEKLHEYSVKATLTDGENVVRFIKNETVSLSPRGYFYYSLVSLGETKVTESGCKYPLTDAIIRRAAPDFAVSNEIIGEAAVTVSGDGALLIESGRVR